MILLSVRSSLRPSIPPNLWSATPLRPLNRISWNFQELFTTWCHTAPPILNFYPHDFGVSQSKTRTLPYKTWRSGGYHFVSIAHSISSFYWGNQWSRRSFSKLWCFVQSTKLCALEFSFWHGYFITVIIMYLHLIVKGIAFNSAFLILSLYVLLNWIYKIYHVSV